MTDLRPPTFLESLAEELAAKYRRLDTLLTHAPTKGTYHEKLLRTLLKNYLPTSFNVGEGFVMNKESKTSSQLDIMVVDNLDPRSYGYKDDDFFIAFDIALTTFGEVKTYPTKTEFIKAFHKLINTSQLLNDSARVTSFLFCYDVPTKQETYVKWIESAMSSLLNKDRLKPWQFPDYIFCFKKGVIHYREINLDSVQYFSKTSKKPETNLMQQLIISRLIECVNNGCGRIRKVQNIKLYP